jgi:hypothetical protein
VPHSARGYKHLGETYRFHLLKTFSPPWKIQSDLIQGNICCEHIQYVPTARVPNVSIATVGFFIFFLSFFLSFFRSLLRIRPIGLFQFRIISEIMNDRQTVELLGWVISSSQGLYLHRTTQRRQTRINIHALSGIRTRDPVYERSRPAPQTAQPLDRHHRIVSAVNDGVNCKERLYIACL